MFRSFLIIYVMLTSAADANNRTYTIACVDKDSIHGFTFQYAFELFSPKLNNSGLILQPNLIGGVQEVYCSSLAATVDAFLLITQEKGANGFIGPDCPKAMDMFGILASKSNHMLPLLGYELTFVDSYDYNPTDYQATLATLMSDTMMFSQIAQLLYQYGWNTYIGLLCGTGPYKIPLTCESAVRTLTDLQLPGLTDIEVKRQNFNEGELDSIKAAFQEVKTLARIIIFLASEEDFATFMALADDSYDAKSGEYIFIYVRSTAELTMPGSFIAEFSKNNSIMEPLAFFMLHRATYFGENYHAHINEIEMAYKFLLSNTPGMEQTGDITANIFVGYLFDSVQLYVETLREAVVSGLDPFNGSLIAKMLRRSEFEGLTGFVKFDSNGDRYEDLSFSQLTKNGWKELFIWSTEFSAVKINQSAPIWPGGKLQPPLSVPPCGWQVEFCVNPTGLTSGQTAGVAVASIIFSALAIGIVVYKKYHDHNKLGKAWMIASKDLNVINEKSGAGSSISLRSCRSDFSGHSTSDHHQKANFKGDIVFVKRPNAVSLQWNNREVLKDLNLLLSLHHDNINRFYGCCVEPNQISFIFGFCSKGCLADVLRNDRNIEWLFKTSFMSDLINGLSYLHNSEFKYHGSLTSNNCLIDSRWVLKLQGFGLNRVLSRLKMGTDQEFNDSIEAELLWVAPELLANPNTLKTAKTDTYSFGIVVQEILTCQGPFESLELNTSDILKSLMGGRQLKSVLTKEHCNNHTILINIVESCISVKPENRPTLTNISRVLREKRILEKTSMMDQLVKMLEKHALNLEDTVSERTKDLLEEKKKTDQLLYKMLPRSIAERLKAGENVQAETFDHVSIYFSDIVGFTTISATSTPNQVVVFLNSLYSLFDSTIGHYDVYKVETIGDAYMVVSGLPIPNGHRHASEIADMSLKLLTAVQTFKIPHLPKEVLRLRIGLHTGSCCAGVVGLTMPRYCLFGDTVNTASRMESTGEALKIHMSSDYAKMLKATGDYVIFSRGTIDVKGKGPMETFWLMGKITDALERKETKSTTVFDAV